MRERRAPKETRLEQAYDELKAALRRSRDEPDYEACVAAARQTVKQLQTAEAEELRKELTSFEIARSLEDVLEQHEHLHGPEMFKVIKELECLEIANQFQWEPHFDEILGEYRSLWGRKENETCHLSKETNEKWYANLKRRGYLISTVHFAKTAESAFRKLISTKKDYIK